MKRLTDDMAKSLKQVQAELLTEGYIDDLADDPVQRGNEFQTRSVEDMLVKIAAEFIIAVRENLDKAGKVSTGGLTDGIAAGEVVTEGDKYTIEIGYDPSDPASKYYDFVNKGVRGIKSGNPASSPYSFKKLSAPPVMVNAIRGWLRTNNISARNEDQRRDTSRLQQKRRRISDLQDPEGNFAYAIALSIKRQGLRRTDYFDAAVRAYFGKGFTDAIAKAAVADVRVAIRKFNPSQNA